MLQFLPAIMGLAKTAGSFLMKDALPQVLSMAGSSMLGGGGKSGGSEDTLQYETKQSNIPALNSTSQKATNYGSIIQDMLRKYK